MEQSRFTYLRYLRMALFPSLVVVIGTAGYMLLEEWTLADALYMTVITLSTVGFGEVGTLSPIGRHFTTFLIIAGVGSLTVVFSGLTEAVISGHLTGAWQRNRLRRRMKKLQEHYIICGYGRVGSTVVNQLRSQPNDILVVDSDAGRAQEIDGDRVHFLHGDATREDTLLEAGIDRAAGLCFCLSDDADNLFAVLAARTLNREINITARVETTRAEDKMRFAGADQIVNPTSIAGFSIALQLIQPSAVKAFEFLHAARLEGHVLESIHIGSTPHLVHKRVGEIGFRTRMGISILHILREDRTLVVDVNADTLLYPEDTLLVLGSRASVTELVAQIQI